MISEPTAGQFLLGISFGPKMTNVAANLIAY